MQFQNFFLEDGQGSICLLVLFFVGGFVGVIFYIFVYMWVRQVFVYVGNFGEEVICLSIEMGVGRSLCRVDGRSSFWRMFRVGTIGSGLWEGFIVFSLDGSFGVRSLCVILDFVFFTFLGIVQSSFLFSRREWVVGVFSF